MHKHTANEILDHTINKIEGAYAPSTIRAYRSNFERFIQFCEMHNIDALPANPSDIALYIAQLTKSSLKSSSIRIAVASISSIHKLNCFGDPTQHPDVKIEMRRMHRQLGRSRRQAFGVTSILLERMLAITGGCLRGSRNQALLLVAYDTMCRRSELVSLRIEDISIHKIADQVEIKILLRASKTDQDRNGRWVYLSKRSYDAIFQWVKLANINDGNLFRSINNSGKINEKLSGNQINKIYKYLAKQIGLSKETILGISGHSIRVGAAQDLLKCGASMPTIMQRGRWSKTDTVMQYLEKYL